MPANDLLRAFRGLLRAPRFALACALTLVCALAGSLTLANLLEAGREFTWSDVSGAAPVAVVNRELATRLFASGDALGRTVTIGARRQRSTIVGIVVDATPGDPRVRALPQVFEPLAATAPAAPALLVRHHGHPPSEAALRAAIEPFGRHQVLRVRSMAQQVRQFLAQEELIVSTALLFATIATLVAGTGLGAAMAQHVVRRTREIAIRVAVGATPSRVRLLILSDALWIVGAGCTLGVALAIAVGRAATPLLSGPRPHTAALLVACGLATLLATVVVSLWPAERAANTPVIAALRTE